MNAVVAIRMAGIEMDFTMMAMIDLLGCTVTQLYFFVGISRILMYDFSILQLEKE